MNGDNNYSDSGREESSDAPRSEGDSTGGWPRREPTLHGFDEDDTYEEPERDTDYASIYSEVDEEEEAEAYQEDAPAAEDLFTVADNDVDDPDQGWSPTEHYAAEEDDWQAEADSYSEGDSTGPLEQPAWETPLTDNGSDIIEQPEEDWHEVYPEEEEAEAATWPPGLIVIALIALVLLGAGGYGVMQQRSQMKEQIRQLQAAMATSASLEDVAASREAVTAMEQHNAELQGQVESLSLENRHLQDTLAGLEAQLKAQQAAQDKALKAAVKPVPVKAAPAPAPTKPAAAADIGPGDWFVNFGSYSQRATAESWVSRLQAPDGKVVVSSGKRDGKTYYRVRVVDLADKNSAEKIARQLEKEYGLDKLWVGQQ